MDEAVKGVWQAHPAVLFAWLFGSQATGRAGPLSDYDFAVYLDLDDTEARFQQGLRLAGEIALALRTPKVDVVVLNDAPPELAYGVLRNGRLLFCRDQEAFERYWVRTCAVYLDRDPMRRLYGCYLDARLREGCFGVRR